MITSPADTLITVVGGSGFVGRQIVRGLAKRGYRVRVACRRPDLAGAVTTAGTPGQIALVQANVRFPESVRAACEGAYAVINATGTDVSSGAQSFDAVVRLGAETVAKAAKAAGAQQMIMISGLGADNTAPSEAARAKGLGEAAMLKAFPAAMILRPSVVFGPEDRFFNKLAGLARFSPVLPLFGGGGNKVQPVFVGDVAEAAVRLVERGHSRGKVYELGGPDVVTMKEVTEFALQASSRTRLLLPLPWGFAKMLAAAVGWLPGAPITRDQIELLKPDNVVSEKAIAEGRDLAGLGITARSFRAIVPSYLYRYRKEGQFTAPSGTPQ